MLYYFKGERIRNMKEIFDLIKQEQDRQNNGIELIASENYASKEVREMIAFRVFIS